MEYSKDIVFTISNERVIVKEGQAGKKFIKFIKKYKVIATIVLLCGILILLDCVLIHSFITILQML